jgi:hypothetical protein
VQLHDRTWTVSTTAGELEVQQGDVAAPDATIRTDPRTLNGLLSDPATLDAAIAAGTVHTEGDLAALRRLLAVAS